jgi:hypothetical protein
LLHHRDQRANINSSDCLHRLQGFWKSYKKGEFSEAMKNDLSDNFVDATNRAKALNRFNNPSTTVHEFVEEIENLVKQKERNLARRT